MSISDLYSTGFRERNRDHFAAIVRVALSDGSISPDEKAFLDRLAKNLDVSEEEYATVLKNPTKYPVNPPLTYISRIERLFDLTRMVYVDHIPNDAQVRLLQRLGVALGFSPANVKYIIDKALDLVGRKVSLEIFIDEIKNMNR